MDDPNERAPMPEPPKPGDAFMQQARRMTSATVQAIEAMTERNRYSDVAPDILERLRAVESRITEIECRLNMPPAT